MDFVTKTFVVLSNLGFIAALRNYWWVQNVKVAGKLLDTKGLLYIILPIKL